MWCSFLATVLVFGVCPDETISGFADSAAIYRLQELDGNPFLASASISFPAEGKVAGKAPCNSFRGEQTLPYPWINIEKIAATRRACPDLGAEAAFLRALEIATLVEVQGKVLILSNDDGLEMVFHAD